MLKKNYAFFLFITLMLLLFSVSIVSAADIVDNSTDTTSSIVTSDTGIGIDNVICDESEETSENTNMETNEKRLTKQDISQTTVKTSSYSVNVNSYDQLENAVNEAKKGVYSNYTISVTDGFEFYGNLSWDGDKNTKLTINGNGNTLDGQNNHQFIHIYDGETLYLNDITFQYFKSSNREGGCIDNDGGNLYINNCNFLNNKVSDTGHPDDCQGGVIFNHGNGKITITNTLFDSNYVDHGGAIHANGGVIYNQNSATLFIINSVFNKNHAKTNGGALYIKENAHVEIYYSTFTNNKADKGGAIYITGNARLYKDVTTTFSGNSADKGNDICQEGGTVETFPQSNVTVHNYEELSDVIYHLQYASYPEAIINLAEGDYNATTNIEWNGNAILTINGNGNKIKKVVNDCRFIYNRANKKLILNDINFENFLTNDDNGGGAILNEGMLTVNNCFFYYCNARGRHGGCGGAIANINQATATITNSQFEGNNADNNGGAISIEDNSNVTMINCGFYGRNIGYYGGAVYIEGSSNTAIRDSWFNSNQANYGNDIAILGGVLILDNVSMEKKGIHDNSLYCINGVIYNYTTPLLTMSIPEVKWGETITFTGYLKDSNKNALSNRVVHLIAQGFTKDVVTDNKGVFTCDYDSQLGNVGVNEVFASVDRDDANYYYATNITATFDILPTYSVSNYDELRLAVGFVKSSDNNNATIGLFPGNYNATGSMSWGDATGSLRTLIIEGNGLTLDGCAKYQFMIINGGFTLILNNITLTNYNTKGYGGVIENFGNTMISDSTLINNEANEGGAIYNSAGNLVINHSCLEGNVANLNYGGAISNVAGATLKVTDSIFKENYAVSNGGAINNHDSYVTLDGCIFKDNNASEDGAIYNYDDEGTVISLNSVYDGNIPPNFIVEDNKIVLNQTDGYITVEDVLVYVDDMNATPYVGDLNNFTVPGGNHTIYMIVNGTNSSTFSDNLYIITSNMQTPFNVIVDAVNSYVGENISLTAHVTSDDLPVMDGNVTFLVDGEVLLVDGVSCVVPVVDGVASKEVIATSSLLNYTTLSAVYACEGYSGVMSGTVDFNVSKRIAGIDLVVDPVSQQQYKNVTFTAIVHDATPNHKNSTILYDDSYVIFTVNGEVLTESDGSVMHVGLDENGVASYTITIAPGTRAKDNKGALYDYNVTAEYVSENYEETVSDTSVYHVEQSPINIIFNNVVCDLDNVLHPDAFILDYMGKHVIGTSHVYFSINGVDYVDETGTLIVYTVQNGVVSLDDIKCDKSIFPISLRLVVLETPSYFNGENTTYRIDHAKHTNDTTNDTDDNGSDIVKPVPIKSHTLYNHGDNQVKTITLHNNMNVTLELLNNIFNQNFTNGILLIYLDGRLVFNGTTTDDLAMILFELIDELFGDHELKVVFTDENNNTQTYIANVVIE